MKRNQRLLSAKEFAARYIRELIFTGEVEVDGKLSIANLAEELGISRTPIRDALWQLESEGLVTISPRVGAFVRRLTPQEAIDIYRIKEAVEPMIAQWAATRGVVALRDHYYAQTQQLGVLARDASLADYVGHVAACRASLLELADSPPSAEVLAVIDSRVRLLRYRQLLRREEVASSAEQHQRVAAAVRDGDAERARAEMAEHVRYTRMRVQRSIDRASHSDLYWLDPEIMQDEHDDSDSARDGGAAGVSVTSAVMT